MKNVSDDTVREIIEAALQRCKTTEEADLVIKALEEEFEIGISPHCSKEEILKETRRKWAEYSNLGIMFISRFLVF